MLKIIIGGVLIGLGAGLMMLVRGRIAGCSGMVSRLLLPFGGLDLDGLFFILGLLISGLVAMSFFNISNPLRNFTLSPVLLVTGGILVGLGTSLGGGCTSGHGLCGLSLRRKRSVVAVLIFFAVAIVTVRLAH